MEQQEATRLYLGPSDPLTEVTDEDSTERLVVSRRRSRRNGVRLRQGRAVGAASRLDGAQPDARADRVIGGAEGRAGRAAGPTREEGNDPAHKAPGPKPAAPTPPAPAARAPVGLAASASIRTLSGTV